MSKGLDRQLAEIFIACEHYYQTNLDHVPSQERSALYHLLKDALTKTLKAMAETHALLYPGWKTDKDHPGYLIQFQPPALLRVPYHVLPSFPTGEQLEVLWHLSRTIRSGNRSVICLSGSNVMRKVFDVVGDIDFCEYFPVRDDHGFDAMAANLDGTESVACMRLALVGKLWEKKKEWSFPWAGGKPTGQILKSCIDSNDVERSTLKFDYIGNIKDLGIADVTNVVIAVDRLGRRWVSAGLRSTFAAQEAPLVPADWLPNRMNDPLEMGRYIDYLARSIVRFLEDGNSQKCLKRCAALSRVLFVPDITDSITKLVRSSTVLLNDAKNNLERIRDLLEPLADERSRSFVALLNEQLNDLDRRLVERGGPPDELSRRRFHEGVKRIVNHLLSYVRPGDDPSSRRAA